MRTKVNIGAVVVFVMAAVIFSNTWAYPQAPDITTTTLPGGTVGTNYSQTLYATGGTVPYTWSIYSGSLPTGLTLAVAGGITGSPSAAGTYNFTVKVIDTTSSSDTQALQIYISGGSSLDITTTSLPSGTVGTSYTQNLTATGGSYPYTWTVYSGTFPSGLSLMGGGNISGTPTTAGTYDFTVKVIDTASGMDTQALQIVISAGGGGLDITTTTLPGGTISTAYSQTLYATGGTVPYTWSIYSGSLPAGFSLTIAGVISGTPTTAGTYDFTVKVIDTASGMDTQALQIVISAGGGGLDITTTTLPGGTISTAYSQTLYATGGTVPYTWSIYSGSLPAGFSLTIAGVISGTPTTSGTYSFTVKVIDTASSSDTQALQIYISGGSSLDITTTSLPSGTVGTSYTQNLTATGGSYPYTWTVYSGTFPYGLSLMGGGNISGTPTTAGTYNFTVKVIDTASGMDTQALQIVISAGGGGLDITTTTLPGGTISTAYSQTLYATGGTVPYTWSIYSGSLPAGFSLTIAGVISGTPTTSGTYSFTVKVIDTASSSDTQALQIVIGAGGGAVDITTTSLPGGTVNTSYSQTLYATGGTAPYSWSLYTGTLPAGLGLTMAGVISGTPTVGGTYDFTVKVTDSASNMDTQAFQIYIGGGNSSLTITTTTLPNGTVNAAYSQTLYATGGTPPYTWSIDSGGWPGGMTLSSSGVFSGTPGGGGTYYFIAKVIDSTSTSDTQSLQITINSGSSSLDITTTSLPSGTLNTAYNQTLTATGGTVPYSWSLYMGSLPTGLSLTMAGVISGTPTVSGGYNFTVKVTDNTYTMDTQSLQIYINAGGLSLDITTMSLPNAALNTAYSQTLYATGGTVPYTWSLYSGNLPTGLSMTAGGVISGTSTASGSSGFTVKVTDSTAGSDTQSLQIIVPSSNNYVVCISPPNTTLTEGNSVQLTAATNPAGGDSSYTWSSSNTSVATVSSAGIVTGVAGGSCTITAKGNTSGSSGTSSINVNSAVVSVKPSSGNSGNVMVGAASQLTASSNSSGDTSFTWSSSDTGKATVSSSGLVTGVSSGTAVITAAANVTGKTGTYSITVLTQNNMPTAVISASPSTGTAPLNVSFSGSSSTDSDGNIVKYEWMFGDNTSATGQTAVHKYAAAGTFTAKLTVTDDKGAVGESSTTITVKSGANPPVASANANPTTGNIPCLVVFSGAGVDADGKIVLYSWDFDGDGKMDFKSAESGKATWEYRMVGTYTAAFVVTDDSGLMAKDTVTITTIEGTDAIIPVIIITAAPTTGTAPLTANFTVSVTSENSDVMSFLWDFDGNGVTDKASPTTGSSSYTYTEPGTYNATITVTNADGYSAAGKVEVNVTAGNNAPSITSGPTAAPASGNYPLIVTLSAGASDNGGISAYLWDFEGDGAYDYADTSGAATSSVTHTYEDVGLFTPKVMVIDTDGLSTTASGSEIEVTQPSDLKVWINTPADGAAVSGNAVALNANAAPADLVTSVKFQYKLASAATYTDIGAEIVPPPYSFGTTFDVSGFADGTQLDIMAVAESTSSETIYSTAVRVTVDSSDPDEEGWVGTAASKYNLLYGVATGDYTHTKKCRSTETTVIKSHEKTRVSVPRDTFDEDTKVTLKIPSLDKISTDNALVKRELTVDGHTVMKKTMQIEMPYSDDDNDGIIDGHTGKSESDVKLYRRPSASTSQKFGTEEDMTWERERDVTIDLENNIVKGNILEEGEYALFMDAPLFKMSPSEDTEVYMGTTLTLKASDGSGSYAWSILDAENGQLSSDSGSSVSYIPPSTQPVSDTTDVIQCSDGTSTVQITVTVPAATGITGDADSSGDVGLSDLNVVIDIILAGNSSADNAGADADGNSSIELNDLNAVIDIILGG